VEQGGVRDEGSTGSRRCCTPIRRCTRPATGTSGDSTCHGCRAGPWAPKGDAIPDVSLSLQRNRATNLVGEMGTDKTTIAAASAYLARPRADILV